MLVVDTNIAFALLISSPPFHEAARSLHEQDSDWRIEYYGLVELTNVLSRYVRAKLLGADDARDVLTLAESHFQPGIVHVSNSDALNLSLQHKVSAYDARFLCAARQLGVPLITEDVKLRKAVPTICRSLAEALSA